MAPQRIYTLSRFPVAVYPIIGLMAVATGFAGWFVARLCHHPDVVAPWERSTNPHPYLNVKPGESTKFMVQFGDFNSFVGKHGE